MIKVGLTGGIGCGKSTVTTVLSQKGVILIDADKIARDLVALNTQALQEIRTVFGDGVLNNDGLLDRIMLKKQVFADEKKLLQLEAILHPKIRCAIKKKLAEITASSNNHAYVVADIPLLIEKNYQGLFDYIIVVDCLPEQQIQRVQQRDNMDLTTFQSIINRQISREKRLKKASHILDNSGTKKQLLLQIETLHENFIDLAK